jgi:diguanylate cyclase (GGDEF)-like protein
MWDDAVLHIDNRLDVRWVKDNLAVYLNDIHRFEGIHIVDRADRPIFAAQAGVPVPVDSFAAFEPVFGQLVAKVRRAETRRGPLPPARPQGGILTAAIQSVAVATVKGRPFIVTATLVAPDFGRHRPLTARAPIVLATIPIGDAFRDSIASRFLLRAPRMRLGAMPRSDTASVVMRDVNGGAVFTIGWEPQRPGRALFQRIGIPIVLMAGLMLAALLLAYRRSRDMAEGLITSEMRANHAALHDHLTGLPNRSLLLDRMRHSLARLERYGGSLVIHCIDLDRFKEINDELGHPVGDELLRAAAARMAAQCRASDTFARLSGDEFAIVQPDASEAEAARLADRICAAMAEPFELGEGRVFSGCSIGITRTDRGTADPVDLLRQADMALYRAKAEARGTYCLFEPAMDAALKSRRALEADLRDAIAHEALDLFYQPQVDGRGVIVGAEALIRWTHQSRGEISPGLFVPIAEQSGLIGPLGMFTLRRAFEDSHRWPGLRISINISANQLRSVTFVADLAALVADHAVDPTDFELEITEGVLLGDDPATLRKLLELREMGFSLVLDDFGTGFSSLSYLRRYPIDKIKIDRSFIAGLGPDTEPGELVIAIVRLARALRLGVIAEGVETLDQWAWLRSIGCPDSQGFFFRPAMAPAELDGLWRNREQGLWSRGSEALPVRRMAAVD